MNQQLKNYSKKFRAYVAVLVIVLVVLAISGCQQSPVVGENSETEETKTPVETTEASQQETESQVANGLIPEPLTAVPTDRPLVTIEMNDGQKIVLALYPEFAPNTVNNFIELAESKFYDGLIFHRVINGFMIQGGDPQGLGIGGPGYGIPGEFKDNAFDNPINHRPGIISMARSSDPNSAGSQFFICQGETGFLDNQYAGFGQVVEGQEVVDSIAQVQVDGSDKPLKDVIMKSVTVTRQGYTFDAVEKLK